MFLAISGQNELCSTQAVEKEQEKSCSGMQWEGQDNTQSSAQGNPPDIPQCPARGDAEGHLADAEAHTHCSASAAAGLITAGEGHNYSAVILPHFRQCCAHCGVTQSVKTAHSSLLSRLLTVTGNVLFCLSFYH